MPRFWGFHHIAFHSSELRFWQGKSHAYPAVPFDERMRVGDYVFLFWGDDELNGWGIIQKLGERKSDDTRDVTVFISLMQSQLASVRDEIRRQKIFENYDRLKDGPLSSFNDEQARYLNHLCQRGGSSPPDPDEVREEAARAFTLRPVITEFVKGRRLSIDETRFDEFKTTTSANVVGRILDEVESYVVGFLNLEDRREVDYCRIFWGIEDKSRIVVGITASDKQQDEIRRGIDGKLSGIKPPLAPSSYYCQIHNVKDKSGSFIDNLVVIEVGIGHGAKYEFYCTQGDSFYIKQDGTCPKLKGQQLVEEIRRRLKKGLQVSPDSIDKAVLPYFAFSFFKPAAHNRIKIKNIGNATASRIEVDPVPLDQNRYPGKRIDFRPISHLEVGAEVSLVALYEGFGDANEQNRTVHRDPAVIQYMHNNDFQLTIRFSDIEGRRYFQTTEVKSGSFIPGPIKS